MKTRSEITFYLAILVLPVVFVGCLDSEYSQSGNVPKHLIRSEIVEAEFYTTLGEVSPEFLEYIIGWHHGTVQAILEGVQALKNDPEALTSYLEQLKDLEGSIDFELIDRLKENDALYFFEFERANYRDYGLIVLRNGKIVYREVWGADTIRESRRESKSGMPDLVVVDDL